MSKTRIRPPYRRSADKCQPTLEDRNVELVGRHNADLDRRLPTQPAGRTGEGIGIRLPVAVGEALLERMILKGATSG